MTKKKEKKPVFDALFESGVCFAVCVASKSFISREVAAFSKDYFVIINKCDEKRIKELTFYSIEGYKQVCGKNLTADEIGIFKRNKNKFVKVQSNEHGRVYELKGRSFKANYNCINQKIRGKVIRSSQEDKNNQI
jgi:hypothetical protein